MRSILLLLVILVTAVVVAIRILPSEAASGRNRFHHPSRARWLRIASARVNTVFAVGHVASSQCRRSDRPDQQGHANPREQVRELVHSIT